jgi:hypothetical protein
LHASLDHSPSLALARSHSCPSHSRPFPASRGLSFSSLAISFSCPLPSTSVTLCCPSPSAHMGTDYALDDSRAERAGGDSPTQQHMDATRPGAGRLYCPRLLLSSPATWFSGSTRPHVHSRGQRRRHWSCQRVPQRPPISATWTCHNDSHPG